MRLGSDMGATHIGVAAHASRTTTSTHASSQSPHIHVDTSVVVRVVLWEHVWCCGCEWVQE